MGSVEQPDFFQLLETLVKHEVDFILVGGLCGVLQGAPVVTLDMDIVHERSPENIARLLEALDELDAYFRLHPAVITPKRSHLETTGHSLLHTSAGKLDVLGTIDEGKSYNELLDVTEVVEIEGMSLRMLTLEALIEIKERANRDKDRLAVPLLRHTLALREQEDS